MTPDTVFDLASLTKVVATTPSVMQLVEYGRIGLDEPASRYWAEFKGNGKERITIRELLTHYSGLRPGLLPKPKWSGYHAALDRIVRDTLPRPPGTSFNYSDLNFMVLAEVVRRVSRDPLEVYARKRVFEPLGMEDAGFHPGRRCTAGSRRPWRAATGSCTTRTPGGWAGFPARRASSRPPTI